MKIHPVAKQNNSEPSQVNGWYYSEFQVGAINLVMEFDHYGAGEFCKYYWANYPDINSFNLYCNKDLYSGKDTLKAGQNLNSVFEIHKVEADFYISFLISEKPSNAISYKENYYTFIANIKTNKNEFYTDSCIIRK